jgi:Zn-dependent M28 family amino/carboxypeptidase
MAKYHFDATLVFMAVAGEEQGLLGASHWADEARRKNLDVAGMITNDIIGSSRGEDGRRDDRSVRLFANGLSPLLSQMIAVQRGTADVLQEP